MNKETKKDRFNKAFRYVQMQGLANSQADAAKKMGAGEGTFSSALKGETRSLTDKFIMRFCNTFGGLDANYIITGNGSLLTHGDITLSGSGNNMGSGAINNTTNNDNRRYYKGCAKSKNELNKTVSKEVVKLSEPIAGATPFYDDMPVSAGQGELSAVLGSMKPTGWISMPGMPKSIGAFPVVGCSMEPDIKAGDFIAVAEVDRWESVDPEKVYMIITRDDRMIKHLSIDEDSEDFLWCISPNYPRFKVYKSEILFVYRVTFHGRFR